jgi:hypothetical protein
MRVGVVQQVSAELHVAWLCTCMVLEVMQVHVDVSFDSICTQSAVPRMSQYLDACRLTSARVCGPECHVASEAFRHGDWRLSNVGDREQTLPNL